MAWKYFLMAHLFASDQSYQFIKHILQTSPLTTSISHEQIRNILAVGCAMIELILVLPHNLRNLAETKGLRLNIQSSVLQQKMMKGSSCCTLKTNTFIL